MQYLQGLPEQTTLFLYAFGFGFLLGVCYDVFRIVRLLLYGRRKRGRKRPVFVLDLLYVFLCTVFTFFFLLAFNHGKISFFMLLGELLGFFIYYFSLGVVAIRVSNAIIRCTQRAVTAVSGWLMRPIRAIWRFFGKIFRAIRKNSQKKYHFFIKKSKYHLKKQKALLYTIKEGMYPCAENHKEKRKREKSNKSKKKI